MYDPIFERSFSRHEKKKLGYGALFASLFLAFTFCLLFKRDFASLPTRINLKMSSIKDYSSSLHMLKNINETNDVPQPVCNTKDRRTDVCEISGDIRIDSSSASILINLSDQDINNMSWSIRPYPRKEDPTAMKSVREWSVKSISGGISDIIPQCNEIHGVPAVLFSTGGYSGNNFHDFTDIVIPLFLTARQFNGEVKLLITDAGHSLWILKFQKFLEKLSNYKFINIDREKNVHCFKTAILGLNRHPGELLIDSSRSRYTMKDFKTFLRDSFSLPKISAIKLEEREKQSPLLLIIARNGSRAFTNTEEIKDTAEELGFKVVILEPEDPANLPEFAGIVNSCDIMMGVHGAGLTNMVFLPENAVMIQVVPIGVDWVAKECFGIPAKDMNVRYLEYKIEAEESSLSGQFPPGHEVLSNPEAIRKRGWDVFSSVYLKKQNVKVKLSRFRPTLLKAIELLHQ